MLPRVRLYENRRSRYQIRGKSEIDKTVPVLIIRGNKLIQFGQNNLSALIRGRIILEK